MIKGKSEVAVLMRFQGLPKKIKLEEMTAGKTPQKEFYKKSQTKIRYQNKITFARDDNNL
jgi:hypothetical protein